MPEDSWITAFKERTDLKCFGSSGLALFALALKFGYDDLETIGSDAIVDGPDDMSCDLVFIDTDRRTGIIAQSYLAMSSNASAKASKAATLRQAVSYIVEVEIDRVPDRLKASALAFRSALCDGIIDQVYVWFVHNCPSSQNVENELATVASTSTAIIRTKFPGCHAGVYVEQLSSEKFEKLYAETNTPILVNDVIEFHSPSGFEFKEDDWQCFVAPLPLSLLRELYTQHKTNLFSANVRDFLGMKTGESNINFQMKKSLQEKPTNFFVYNNGLTVLTHKIEPLPIDNGGFTVRVHGISIVNGAQTTGIIGTSSESPPSNTYVLSRFISTQSEDLISDVVRYNNSQNAVTASDFRSTDPIQRRLVAEMKSIANAEYDGGRRGGVSAAIKRRPKLLPSYAVGQAIAALHGDPTVSYNEKSAIWSRDSLYSKYFNEYLTAKHVVFCYSLLRAIESEKISLRLKDSESQSGLTSNEKAKLEFYRKRGSVFLFASAIGECLESICGKAITNRFAISFGSETSPDQAMEIWMPTVTGLSNLNAHLTSALSDGLKNAEKVRDTVKSYSQVVASLSHLYDPIFSSVRKSISTN